MDLSSLNNNQRLAVETTEGPVMVMAGAGSGKTRVLTYRIAHLILDLGVLPSSILAVTFTNKAAREMKERVEALTHEDVRHMWVSTFHSFCARFLRIELDSFEGYTSKFTIIDEDDALKIIRDILKNDNVDIKEYKPKRLLGLISDQKNKETIAIAEPFLKNYYPKLYDKYNAALKKDNLLDFDDLIRVSLELLKARPEILAKYRNKFNYIMVDEFQDTNIIQYELIKLLTNDAQNIFIVGDQDQSIYSFRGAKVENIDLFIKNFPMCKQILLEENYRSTNPILKIANNVIDCNKHRIKKNLFTNNDSSELPVYYHTSSGYDETMFVIDKIKELHLLGYPYSDFAILYRANALSRQFEDMLLRYQIPYVIYGGLSFFERKEVKDMIAYLRLIINHNDDFAFKRVVNEPKRKIGEALLEKLKTAQVLNNCSLFEAIDHIETAGIGFSNLIAFKFTIIELFDEYINNEEKPFIEIIDAILNKTGYGNMLKNEGEEGQDRLENILEMKTVIEEALEYYELSRKETLDALLSDLALRTDTDNKSENADCVKLMTYHQAKGLEYRVVFMVAMEQGIFPSFNCISELEQEEERRICYVGITRAKEKLYITNAESRYLYGQQQFESPSIYIKEMGLDNLNIIGTIKRPITTPIASVISKTSAKEEKPEAVEINKGDKINHKAFGDGLVVEKSGNIITVAFPAPYGVKKLSAVHPSIRKI